MASLMRVNLNKNKRYLQTLGPIGRHVKGERNLHPYASLINGQTAKNRKLSSWGKNITFPRLRNHKAVTVQPMK
jgi:hypothetical protein